MTINMLWRCEVAWRGGVMSCHQCKAWPSGPVRSVAKPSNIKVNNQSECLTICGDGRRHAPAWRRVQWRNITTKMTATMAKLGLLYVLKTRVEDKITSSSLSRTTYNNSSVNRKTMKSTSNKRRSMIPQCRYGSGPPPPLPSSSTENNINVS